MFEGVDEFYRSSVSKLVVLFLRKEYDVQQKLA